jgi:3-oxoacyl-[acyl-carrier protein] reductase
MKDNPVFADSQIVDVTDEAQTRAGFAAALDRLGDIDGIVANAGINGPTKPMWEYSLAEWQTVISVDLTGVFLSLQASLDHFLQRQQGRIIIISSIGGKEGNPGAVPYGAAKAGVIGLAKGLAREVLPSEITVNCIAPSIAVTDLLDGMNEEYIADKKSRIPKGRFCTPEEIAHMAAFIASPACSFTTGQVFDVSGGRATW